MKKIIMYTSSIALGLVLSACGSSNETITNSSTLTSGQLVDNYVENVDYYCGDGKMSVTDKNGSFACSKLPVRFQLGQLTLGELNFIPADGQVFPQDLVGVARSDINNTTVKALAQFLQSIDNDANADNGIYIQEQIKNRFTLQSDFNAEDVDTYTTDANSTLLDENTTTQHLTLTTEFVEAVDAATIPAYVKEALLTPANLLTQEVKDTIAFMGNEERLAYDVYQYLYNYHITNSGTAINQFTNIATRSETQHIQTVQLLVKKYINALSDFTNLDATVNLDANMSYADLAASEMPAGLYNIAHIQELYDMLTAKGVESKQAALEVGCIVEVVDVDDLEHELTLAHDSNASDVVTAFEFLRDGSYNHYWAFDKGLRNMGVDGCCVLGDEYCHPEYPQK
ncbi:DUF2202 domain-containing protein [Sulfurimonas sp.]